MPKLTRRLIEILCNRATDREHVVWDSDLPRFGLRLRPEGKSTYVVKYRNAHGRQRKLTVGDPRVLTPEDARTLARQALGKVAGGQDPLSDRLALRQAPTVSDLCDRYLSDHADRHKKASSAKEDRKLIERHVRPKLGHHKVGELTRAEVARLHAAMRDTPVQANRLLTLLSKMFNLAILWGWRTDERNPARLVQRFKERNRERYLTPDELRRLGDVLAQRDNRKGRTESIVPLVRLLILTGARLSEIMLAEWDWVDREAGMLRLPDSKTGAKTIMLSGPALAVLDAIPRIEGQPYVIAGRKPGMPLVNPAKPWDRIRKRAGLEGVRLHDLRHTFASAAVGTGLSLPMIGKLLGHTQASTTERYAHLHDDPVRRAAETTASTLNAWMQGKQGAEIASLRSGEIAFSGVPWLTA